MTTIRNPVLRGFNPDPSILRVGHDYYIATSTFEWFPGVAIHHSRDLVNWNLLTYALDRTSQLDMIGNPDSGGIWAPCLSYHDGLFHLIYTDVKILGHPFKDTPNYLVTAPDIRGPWSDPIFLNASGFDPSLFHDEDGRHWLVNMVWDFRKNHNRFAGIVLQEYSPSLRKLTGPVTNIFKGSSLRVTEGPHLYKIDGYYYLITAEGGTGYRHAVTLARSRNIQGPYEISPKNPILTAASMPDCPLQKAGHGSLVQTPDGQWYLAHLTSRPLSPDRRCPLGRETAIQKCRFTCDHWIELDSDSNLPLVDVPAPDSAASSAAPAPIMQRTDFDESALPLEFQSLRIPIDESWLSLTQRPGHLRLFGRESICSKHHQSLIARRLQSFTAEASTRLQFNPTTFQQAAGLTAYYHTSLWYYLHITHHEDLGRCLVLSSSDRGEYDELIDQPIPLPGDAPVDLKIIFDHQHAQFHYAAQPDRWLPVGPPVDVTRLSDDYAGNCFTGAFIGLCAQDLSGCRLHADFDCFEYREL